MQFALVDCNNFFVSCERVFRPDLRNVPVVVLSNNDGCAVARSNEVKQLGVAMGEPYFKFKHLVSQHGIEVFSSNFSLYADMSQRMFSVLRSISASVEPYSIDEAFIGVAFSRPDDIVEYCREIVQQIGQWIGLPVTVGAAPTKTLAKAANEIAKKSKECKGVLHLSGTCADDVLLQGLPIEDVWGIGRAYARQFKEMGLVSAYDFKSLDRLWLRKRMGVIGEHMWYEFHGQPSNGLRKKTSARKTILSSRSFPQAVHELSELEKAIAHFVTIATAKARRQGSAVTAVDVFISTGHSAGDRYRNSARIVLERPTSYTPDLIAAAHRGLASIYRGEYGYKKAGVIFSGLFDESSLQFDLFSQPVVDRAHQYVMRACDVINQKFGRGAIMSGAEGIGGKWKQRRARVSPVSTTQWDSLPKILV